MEEVAPRMKKTRFVFTARAALGRVRVACEARACRCLCREHGPRETPERPRSGPRAACGLCRGPVPAEGPVWDAMPRLVLTVASDDDEGAPFCSLPPAPPSPPPSLPPFVVLPPPRVTGRALTPLLPSRQRPLARARARSFPPLIALVARALRAHLLPPVFRAVRAAVTRVHACRAKHASMSSSASDRRFSAAPEFCSRS